MCYYTMDIYKQRSDKYYVKKKPIGGIQLILPRYTGMQQPLFHVEEYLCPHLPPGVLIGNCLSDRKALQQVRSTGQETDTAQQNTDIV